MKFVSILSSNSRSECLTSDELKKVCKEKGLNYLTLNPKNLDLNTTKNVIKEKKFLLYRISPDYESGLLEFKLFSKKSITFYNKLIDFFIGEGEKGIKYIFFEKKGLSIPKTIYLPTSNKEALKRYSKELGGFPIIVKISYSEHGRGVKKADSLKDLQKIASNLIRNKSNFILQEYLEEGNKHARCIVLGNKVIDSIEYKAREGSFISNEGDNPNVEEKKFPKDVEELAIKATRALGLEFGGVDIVMSKNKNYVLEVNYPCNFKRCQYLTGKNISGMMVDYLLRKSYNY